MVKRARLGRGDAADDEGMAAARAARCEEFIEWLPQSCHTNIGENGSALSGGERQRILIARALLKNVTIVLLDEATASMDAGRAFGKRRTVRTLGSTSTRRMRHTGSRFHSKTVSWFDIAGIIGVIPMVGIKLTVRLCFIGFH